MLFYKLLACIHSIDGSAFWSGYSAHYFEYFAGYRGVLQWEIQTESESQIAFWGLWIPNYFSHGVECILFHVINLHCCGNVSHDPIVSHEIIPSSCLHYSIDPITPSTLRIPSALNPRHRIIPPPLPIKVTSQPPIPIHSSLRLQQNTKSHLPPPPPLSPTPLPRKTVNDLTYFFSLSALSFASICSSLIPISL